MGHGRKGLYHPVKKSQEGSSQPRRERVAALRLLLPTKRNYSLQRSGFPTPNLCHGGMSSTRDKANFHAEGAPRLPPRSHEVWRSSRMLLESLRHGKANPPPRERKGLQAAFEVVPPPCVCIAGHCDSANSYRSPPRSSSRWVPRHPLLQWPEGTVHLSSASPFLGSQKGASLSNSSPVGGEVSPRGGYRGSARCSRDGVVEKGPSGFQPVGAVETRPAQNAEGGREGDRPQSGPSSPSPCVFHYHVFAQKGRERGVRPLPLSPCTRSHSRTESVPAATPPTHPKVVREEESCARRYLSRTPPAHPHTGEKVLHSLSEPRLPPPRGRAAGRRQRAPAFPRPRTGPDQDTLRTRPRATLVEVLCSLHFREGGSGFSPAGSGRWLALSFRLGTFPAGCRTGVDSEARHTSDSLANPWGGIGLHYPTPTFAPRSPVSPERGL